MESLISWLLIVLVGLTAVPTSVLFLEILAGVVRRPTPSDLIRHPGQRVAVLVPAHNESTAIALTLEDIRAQLASNDVLLVVADNCTDDTAAVAKMSGAQVVERQDSKRIGKGYALDFGLRHLDRDPPDIVVMIDADCRLADGAIDQLASACGTANRPVQALDLMIAPDESPINQRVAEFAWRVKNWVRPLGLAALSLPCQLMGTGMAFPWQVIRATNLASGSVVEDLKLGLDLAAAGHPPLFCPSARVTSQFTASARAADNQRRRWEHGHVKTIVEMTPRLLHIAIARRNLGLLALTLDLAVPPLSLLALLLILMFAITGIATLFGFDPAALLISAACLVGFAAAITLAWTRYGRDILPPNALLSVPCYILAKLGLYGQILLGRMTAQWVRTDRTRH